MLNKLLEDGPSLFPSISNNPLTTTMQVSDKASSDFSSFISLESTDPSMMEDHQSVTGNKMDINLDTLTNNIDSDLVKKHIPILDDNSDDDQKELVPLMLSAIYLQDIDQHNLKTPELTKSIPVDNSVPVDDSLTTTQDNTKTLDFNSVESLDKNSLFKTLSSQPSSSYNDKNYMNELVQSNSTDGANLTTVTQNNNTIEDLDLNKLSNLLEKISSDSKNPSSNITQPVSKPSISSPMPSRLDPTGAMNIVHKMPPTVNNVSNYFSNKDSSTLVKNIPTDTSYFKNYVNPTMYLDQNSQNQTNSNEFSSESDLDTGYIPYIDKGSFQPVSSINFGQSLPDEGLVLNEVVNSLVTEASFLISSNKSSSSINLEKYGLGKLTISVEKNNGNMSLNIDTTNNEVKDLLTKNITALKDSLEQNQLRFDGGISVQSSSSTEWATVLPSNTENSGYNYQEQGTGSGSYPYSEQGNSSSYSQDSFTDQGYSSSTSDSFNQEVKTDSSYSRKKINHSGKIQVLI